MFNSINIQYIVPFLTISSIIIDYCLYFFTNSQTFNYNSIQALSLHYSLVFWPFLILFAYFIWTFLYHRIKHNSPFFSLNVKMWGYILMVLLVNNLRHNLTMKHKRYWLSIRYFSLFSPLFSNYTFFIPIFNDLFLFFSLYFFKGPINIVECFGSINYSAFTLSLFFQVQFILLLLI